MNITDIFGNSILVTNLPEALSQTRRFVSMSEKSEVNFTEHYFVDDVDQWNKPFRSQRTPKNPKIVSGLDFYKHQLKELQNLTQ